MAQVGARAPVAGTRLRVPRVPQESVRRSRLIDKTIGRRPLTLVCAPAGSGKTIAVADWATEVLASGEAVAWLSVDPRDDRPYEFWSALLASLAAAASPESARRIDALSPPRQGLERGFVVALIELLTDDAGIRWLVLDDLHLVRHPDVAAGLDLLLSAITDVVGVVIGARFEPPIPLPRWRVEGRLVEAHGPELAFSEAEARQLFAHLDAGVDEADIARLVVSTEGWAAGLRLAAVSIVGGGAMRGAPPEIAGDQREVADYLFTEIVRHLPAQTRDFLLDTAVPEQLSIDLAALLSGRPDAGAELDRLCRANALVVQSGHSPWYRYHALLRTYLLTELAKRDATGPQRQHGLAARWFAEHGEPAIAIEHASASGDEELLTALVREHGLRLILSGRAAVVADVVGARPTVARSGGPIATVAALAALDLGELGTADAWLAVARSQPDGADPRLSAQLASAVVQRALLDDGVEAAVAETAILDLQLTGDADVDLMLLVYRAPARLRSGDYPGAVGDLEQALRLSRSGGYDPFVLTVLSQLAATSGTLCDFGSSLDWAEQAIAFAAERGWVTSPRVAYAYLLAAWTGFQMGDLEAQSAYAEQAVSSLDGVTDVEIETGVLSMHALARFERSVGRERLDAAARFHEIWSGPNAAQVSPALTALAVPEGIRLALAVGRTDWAQEAVERVASLLPGSADAATMHAQVLAAQGRGREALDLLAPVLTGQADAHVATTVVQANVLAAGIEASLGHDHRAFEALRTALDWAASCGYVRPFANAWGSLRPLVVANQGRFGLAEEFVTALLRDLPETAGEGGVVGSHFSRRELDVLRDLASALTVKEIADAQGVSVNTIKTHVSKLYAKLGVGKRSAAVREGRNRGLL